LGSSCRRYLGYFSGKSFNSLFSRFNLIFVGLKCLFWMVMQFCLIIIFFSLDFISFVMKLLYLKSFIWWDVKIGIYFVEFLRSHESLIHLFSKKAAAFRCDLLEKDNFMGLKIFKCKYSLYFLNYAQAYHSSPSVNKCCDHCLLLPTLFLFSVRLLI
jgi:hypothetical protein